MGKVFTNPFVKILAWCMFVAGIVGLFLCGVDIKNVNNIVTLISGSLSSVGSILIQIINSVKNKLPEAKG